MHRARGAFGDCEGISEIKLVMFGVFSEHPSMSGSGTTLNCTRAGTILKELSTSTK